MNKTPRKPSEMTLDEIDQLNKIIPAGWTYCDLNKEAEIQLLVYGSIFTLVDAKRICDYLQSINVDPYAE